MANDTTLNTPVLWINKYLENNLPSDIGFGVPFFPSVPSTIDSLTEQWVTVSDQDNGGFARYPYAGVMATWDRMFRMTRDKLPHIKEEQVLYYFYATEEQSVVKMVQVQESLYRLLGRLDESAEEVNNWCSNRRINLGNIQSPNLVDNMFYFHSFKIYQLEEVRDIIDFGTARTYAGNKIIIDYCYHQMPALTRTDWKPEPPRRGDNKIVI